MALSLEEVEHIALLSRIGLEENEKALYREDLSRALDWFAALQAVNTEGVEAMDHITGEKNNARKDGIVAGTPFERATILSTMPDKKDDYTKVRSVF